MTCPCCLLDTAETNGKGWRCWGCHSSGVMVDGRMAVTRAAEGTHYFDPVKGPEFRAQVRADLDKIDRERGS